MLGVGKEGKEVQYASRREAGVLHGHYSGRAARMDDKVPEPLAGKRE